MSIPLISLGLWRAVRAQTRNSGQGPQSQAMAR